jgi:putative ABC transport system permease protein
MLRQLRACVKGLLRREAIDGEVDEELRFHLEMEIQANVQQGMTPDEARRSALRDLGGVTQTREAVGDVRGIFLDSVRQDLRYGLRVLRRSPAYALGVIATLGIGIGATTAVFSVADAAAFRPLPYPNPGRLFGLHSRSTSDGRVSTGVSTRDFLAWRDHVRAVAEVSLVGGGRYNLVEGEPEELRGCVVTGDLFATLGTKPLLGRAFGREHEITGNHWVAVLGHAFWQRRFGGDPHIVGRRLRLDGGVYEVVGVMPDGFTYPAVGRPFDLWTPFAFDSSARDDVSPARGAVLRLKDGVTPQQANARLQSISMGLKQAPGFGWLPFLLPLHEVVLGDTRRWMAWLLAASGFVLLIACANVAHLTLSRMSGRSRELAVRRALGGGRARLVRQLATESLLLSTAATIVGLSVAWWGVRLLNASAPRSVARLAEIAIDGRVLTFAIASGLVTGLLCAVLPALRGAGADVVEGLKDGGHSATAGRARRRVREAMAFSEVALSFVLLAGAALFIASFVRLMTVDPGFDVSDLLVVEVGVPAETAKQGRALADIESVLERMRQSRGVQGAGLISGGWLFGGGRMSFPAHEPGSPRPKDQAESSDFAWITPGFFRVLGVPLIDGRDLNEYDTSNSPPVILVNQTAARRHWGTRNPVGRQLVIVDRTYEVVGLVGDIAHLGSDAGPRPALYIPLAQMTRSAYGSFVVRAKGPSADVTSGIRRAVRSVWPQQPISRIASVEDGIWRRAATRRFNTMVMAVFGVLAVVIAISGLNSVMRSSVDERRREMAIRLALGARRGQVLLAVLGRSATIILLGVTAGAGAAWALGRYIESYLFEIRPHDLRVLTTSALLLAAVAVLACWPPALRASRTDPVVTLKTE